MTKKFCALLLAVCLLLGLCGCGSSQPAETETSASETTQPTLPPADGYDELGGNWLVGGIYYTQGNRTYLVDISDNDALADLYDGTFLTFRQDGTFVYYNLFFHTGTYTRREPDAAGNETFLLKTESVFTYEMVDGELVEKEASGSKSSYLLTVLQADDALQFSTMDPMTGRPKTDDMPLVFQRDETDSSYIEDRKTPLKDSGDSSGTATRETTPAATRPAGATPTPPAGATSGQKNALASAKSYLNVMPFSYEGLIEQLEYEGYTSSEAKYGADYCGADWYEQAIKSAKNYLNTMAFSYTGLIDQLEYEGFTADQAEYGVDHCGADWYEQAVKSAKSYLEFMSFSRSDLIDQLIYEGFTRDQAEYGVNKAY